MNEIIQNECVITGDMPNKNENEHLTDITKPKISGIYKIVNKINGKYYVGKSSRIAERKCEHWCDLKHNRHFNIHLQHAWNKYGTDAFEFIVIELCSVNKLKELETYYLQQCNRRNSYNMTTESPNGMGRPRKTINMIVRREARRIWIQGGEPPLYKYLKLKGYGRRIKDRLIKSFKENKEDYDVQLYNKKGRREQWGRELNRRYGSSVSLHETASETVKSNGSLNGPRNGQYDKTTFTFENTNTHEIFSGTCYEFSKNYNINKYIVSNMKRKRTQSKCGWTINFEAFSLIHPHP